jgi:1-acyl-sn-glycerol-3-phosphate acyltransferase
VTILGLFQWVFIALLTLLVGPPFTLLGWLAGTRERKGKLFRYLSKRYAGLALWMPGVTVEPRGVSRVDPDKGYIFMSTHTSHLDSPALAIALPQPTFWVFKKELAKIPVFGWVLLALGQVMVDRSNAKQARESIGQAGRELTGSLSILIYPEGTRSKDGKLQPLKKGGFHLALGAGIPIVPVRITGSYDLLPRGALTVRPGRVVVELFDPIPTAGKTEADIPGLMERVRAALLS